MKKRRTQRLVNTTELAASLHQWWRTSSKRVTSPATRRAALTQVRRGRKLLEEFLGRAEKLADGLRPVRPARRRVRRVRRRTTARRAA
jgi:hypothetical protein